MALSHPYFSLHHSIVELKNLKSHFTPASWLLGTPFSNSTPLPSLLTIFKSHFTTAFLLLATPISYPYHRVFPLSHCVFSLFAIPKSHFTIASLLLATPNSHSQPPHFALNHPEISLYRLLLGSEPPLFLTPPPRLRT
jgi:hypothetical protein